jgi:hypothetical protein
MLCSVLKSANLLDESHSLMTHPLLAPNSTLSRVAHVGQRVFSNALEHRVNRTNIKLSNSIGDWVGNNVVAPFAKTVTQQGMNMVGSALGSVGNVAGPLMMLPLAYGLLTSNGNNNQQQTPPQSNYIQPNYIQPNPYMVPRGTKVAGAGTGAIVLSSLHRKAINTAVNNLTTKKDVAQQQPAQSTSEVQNKITSSNPSTQKLLEHKEVKDYINSLLNA